MKKLIITMLLLTSLTTVLCSCTSSSTPSSTSSYDGMSDRYHTDKEYRDNVNSSARAYGVSPKEAEDSAERVLDAIH